jgi:hypothetical protein
MMMSNADAELAVRRELEKLQLKKPMTPAEVFVFSQDMYLKLEFRSKGDRLSDVRICTERWLSTRFPHASY